MGYYFRLFLSVSAFRISINCPFALSSAISSGSIHSTTWQYVSRRVAAVPVPVVSVMPGAERIADSRME